LSGEVASDEFAMFAAAWQTPPSPEEVLFIKGERVIIRMTRKGAAWDRGPSNAPKVPVQYPRALSEGDELTGLIRGHRWAGVSRAIGRTRNIMRSRPDEAAKRMGRPRQTS